MTHTLHRQGNPEDLEGGLRPSAPDIPLREPRGLRGDDAPGLGGDLPLREGPGQLREPQPHLGRRRALRHGVPQDGRPKAGSSTRSSRTARRSRPASRSSRRRIWASRPSSRGSAGRRKRSARKSVLPPTRSITPWASTARPKTSRRGRSWRSTPCADTRWSPPA